MTSDAGNIIGVYQRQGLNWAADREKQSIEPVWFERFCALLPPGANVLDLGCGTGHPVAKHLIEHGFALTGIDTAPDMLARCKQRFPDHEWHLADMRTLDLGRVFQGILAWNSFFHLDHDDQRRVFPIFRAHAAPGAPLMFTSGPAHGEALGCLYGETLYHSSLAPAEYRDLLVANNFEERAHVAQDPQCCGLTVWLAQQTGHRTG